MDLAMTPELDMNKHTSAGSTVFKASRVAHDTDDLYQINARHCRNCVFIVCSNQLVISHHTDKYFRSTSSHRQGWLTTARQVNNSAHLTPPLADLDNCLRQNASHPLLDIMRMNTSWFLLRPKTGVVVSVAGWTARGTKCYRSFDDVRLPQPQARMACMQ